MMRGVLFLLCVFSITASAADTCPIKRDAHGKIVRSTAVARAFQKEHPCPSTGKTTGRCPGYVKDHIKPLACGGCDRMDNIQWQTVAEAKAKDRWEIKQCGGAL